MVLALRPDAAVRRSVESVTPFERRRLEAHSILSELLGFVRRGVGGVSQPLQVLPNVMVNLAAESPSQVVRAGLASFETW